MIIKVQYQKHESNIMFAKMICYKYGQVGIPEKNYTAQHSAN